MPDRKESHFLVCMCLFCDVLVVLFGVEHLIGSWSPIDQVYMDLLVDETSTISSCQHPGGVFYPMICMHGIACFVWDCQMYEVCDFCILYHFEWYFVFFILSSFHIQIFSHGKLELDFPCLCACLVNFSVKFDLHFMKSLCKMVPHLR